MKENTNDHSISQAVGPIILVGVFGVLPRQETNPNRGIIDGEVPEEEPVTVHDVLEAVSGVGTDATAYKPLDFYGWILFPEGGQTKAQFIAYLASGTGFTFPEGNDIPFNGKVAFNDGSIYDTTKDEWFTTEQGEVVESAS